MCGYEYVYWYVYWYVLGTLAPSLMRMVSLAAVMKEFDYIGMCMM